MMQHFYKTLFIVFLSVACINSTSSQNQAKIDSLLRDLQISKDDTSKVNTLLDLGWQLLYINPDTSIILTGQALLLSDKAKSKKHIADSYLLMALANYLKGSYQSTLENSFKALSLKEDIADKLGIAKCFNSIGNVYSDQCDYPKALDYFLKGLRMMEELGHNSGISKFLANIGSVYEQQGEYQKALDYYFKALKMAEQLGNKMVIATILGNIGMVYHEHQDDYPKALDYYFKALKLAEQLGDQTGMARHSGNIGMVYYDQRDYSKALDYYFKALKMDKEFGNLNGIGFWLGHIGTTYNKTGSFAEAEKYLKNAITIVDSIGVIDDLMVFEETLSQLYDTTGRYKLALEHFKKAMVLKDTLFNQEKDNQITRKQMSYEFEKIQAAEKAGHEKQLAVVGMAIKKQTLLKNSFLGGFCLTLALFFLIYNNYRTSQKLKLETIRNNIAADLHDDIGSTLNSISLFSEVAKQEAGKSIPALDQIGISARKIIDAMSDIVWTINPENDTFENVIVRMRSLSYLLLKAKEIEFTFKADDNLNSLSLSMPVRKNFYLLFKEAVNNMVKYSNATQASFHLSLVPVSSGKNVKMVIHDNGVGFDTVSAPGEGNGIKNMKKRAAEIGAQLVITSAQGEGTTIELNLKS